MISINKLSCRTITITSGTPGPVPDGKVLYKTAKDGEWLQDDANISGGTFNGFATVDKTTAVEVILPSKDASGNSVTSIGNGVFQYCSSLTSVTIPNSVTSIESNAFYGCSRLTSFIVGDGNASYKSVDGLLLSKDGKTLVAVPGGLTSVTIPDSVTSIGDKAFSGCTGLTSVMIPDSVRSIGYQGFRNCTSLESVTIPHSVESIGHWAFVSCNKLTSVTIPDSVESIGSSAFSDCGRLTIVTFQDKTLAQVQEMVNYPWGISNTSIIHVA